LQEGLDKCGDPNNEELKKGIQSCAHMMNAANRGELTPEEQKERQERAMQVIITIVDASAYFLSGGWLRIETKPTPPPAVCAM
jgi:hypothetical protein